VSGPRDRHAPSPAGLDAARRTELVNQAAFVYDLIDVCASKVNAGRASPFAIEVMREWNIVRAEERRSYGLPPATPPAPPRAVLHPIE
jgi:hypothetical protein